MRPTSRLCALPCSLILASALGCSAGGDESPITPPQKDGGAAGGDGGWILDSSTPPDAAFACTPGVNGCYGKVHYVCADDGVTRLDEQECPSQCDPSLGCVSCKPGTRSCEGNVSMICAPDAQTWVHGRDCAEWKSQCGDTGYCSDACGQAEATMSYVGCEYWPAPLANTSELNQAVFDYRVVVANPNEQEAEITVTRGATQAFSGKVGAHQLVEIPLPWVDGQSFGIGGGEWKSIATKDGAYRLRSSLPVTVSQFNPFEYQAGTAEAPEYSYTNDATLLLPTHVMTGDYVNVTYLPFTRASGMTGGVPMPPDYMKYPGYLAIVGITPEPVHVAVTVSANAIEEKGGKFNWAPPGGTIEFDLQRGEVVHLTAAPPPDCTAGRPGYVREQECTFGICDWMDTCAEPEFDLTGSRIRASGPVEVFGGHVCAYVPYTSQACDHLESVLSPIQTWGKVFVSRPMTDGGGPGDNLVRVVAAFDDTEVTVNPPQGSISTVTLQANEWVEFMASTPFVASGSKAIQVAQYLVGQHYSKPAANRGDPAMTVLVPSEQYRADYIFVTPSSYNAGTNGQNFVMIVRPPNLSLTLDGNPLDATWQAIGGKEVGIVAVEGGTHTMKASDKFGMITYGLGSYTSYAYPAGLDLKQITQVVK